MLWLVILVEFLMGWLKQHYTIRYQNNYIYNVLTTLQYIYFFLLYYYTMKTRAYRKWVLVFLIFFLIAVLINFILIQPLKVTATFYSYTFTIGAILLIVTIGLFLVEILNTEKVLYFQRYLMFWISIGLIVFYAGIIPYVIAINFLPQLLSSGSMFIIFFLLNFVMYSCFIVGFIASNKFSE
jgi:hypothetical protein